MAFYSFDPPTSCQIKGEVKYGHIGRLLLKRPNNLRFRIFVFLFQEFKMKAFFFANMYFNVKFSLDVKVVEVLGSKQRENAASSGFPHFSGQSETRD